MVRRCVCNSDLLSRRSAVDTFGLRRKPPGLYGTRSPKLLDHQPLWFDSARNRRNDRETVGILAARGRLGARQRLVDRALADP
jgi:hypothetical protein